LISVRSVQEIDHLIEGLQGLREKLNNDGDRLNRQIVQYGAFSQSIPDEDRLGRDGVSEQIKRCLKTFQSAREKSPDEDGRDSKSVSSTKEELGTAPG
jgi:hypothetical protein